MTTRARTVVTRVAVSANAADGVIKGVLGVVPSPRVCCYAPASVGAPVEARVHDLLAVGAEDKLVVAHSGWRAGVGRRRWAKQTRANVCGRAWYEGVLSV
jgi:hypothetical protein